MIAMECCTEALDVECAMGILGSGTMLRDRESIRNTGRVGISLDSYGVEVYIEFVLSVAM